MSLFSPTPATACSPWTLVTRLEWRRTERVRLVRERHLRRRRHLVHNVGIDAGRVGVLGLSMGGEEAITAAANDGRIGAVDAEGATMRTTDDFLEIDRGLAMWLSAPHYSAMYTTAECCPTRRRPNRSPTRSQSSHPARCC
jgi:hypothetical protein